MMQVDGGCSLAGLSAGTAPVKGLGWLWPRRCPAAILYLLGQEALSCIDSFAGLLAALCVLDYCRWRYRRPSSAPLPLTRKPLATGRSSVWCCPGARGAAHLGVLKVIEEMGIPVDIVVGTSMGSVVGGLYSSGLSVADIDRVVRDNDWTKVLSDGPAYEELSMTRKREVRSHQLGGRLGLGGNGIKLPSGLREGQNVRLMLRHLTRHVADINCFSQLALPFGAVATDVETGEAVVLDHGDLVTAMRASMAIPGYFSPVELDGKVLVDGGPANNMPVSLARAMGADVVIAIDIGTPMSKRDKMTNLLGISMQMSTMLARETAEEEIRAMKKGDVLIVPDLSTVATLDFEEMGDAIAAGEAAARKSLADYPWRGRLAPEQLPSARFAQRLAISRAPAKLASVSVTGDQILPPKQVTDRFRMRPGEDLDDKAINEGIARVYGLDYFSTVDYARTPGEDGDALALDIRHRNWGPTYMQFGLGLYNNFEGISRYSLGASVTMTELNRFTGQFNLQAQVGDVYRLAAEFYQPMTAGAALFVAPRILYDRHNFDIYYEADLFARLQAGTEEGGIDLGWTGAHSEWRLGYAAGQRRMALLIGLPVFPAESYDSGHVRMVGEYNSMDKAALASKGTQLDWLAEMGRPEYGSDGSFDHLRLRASHTFLAGRQRIQVAMGAETVDTRGGIVLEPAQLGGSFEMAAFADGELSGENAGFARLATWWQANDAARLPLYFGGALEYGGAWNGNPSDMVEADLWPTASLFAGVSTPIGPVLLTGGVSEHGRSAVHFQLGHSF